MLILGIVEFSGNQVFNKNGEIHFEELYYV